MKGIKKTEEKGKEGEGETQKLQWDEENNVTKKQEGSSVRNWVLDLC